MENATKALLIAGAVLLVIMIISVGLMIFNSANESITGAIGEMSSQAKQQQNQKFTTYEGIQTGSSVKTLIGTVITHNKQMTDEGTPEKGVSIKWDGSNSNISIDGVTYAKGTNLATQPTATLEKLRQAVVSGGKYKVTCETNGQTGLIDVINLSRDNSTSAN